MPAARIAVVAGLALIWGTLGLARDVTDWLRPRHLLEPTILAGAALLVTLAWWKLRNRALLITMAAAAALFSIAWFAMGSPEERVHLIEYGLIAVLFEASFRTRRIEKAFVATAAAGWIDEGIQALLPSRHYDLRDVGFNALAAALGLGLLLLYRLVDRR